MLVWRARRATRLLQNARNRIGEDDQKALWGLEVAERVLDEELLGRGLVRMDPTNPFRNLYRQIELTYELIHGLRQRRAQPGVAHAYRQ